MRKTNFIFLSFVSAVLFANSLHAMEEDKQENACHPSVRKQDNFPEPPQWVICDAAKAEVELSKATKVFFKEEPLKKNTGGHVLKEVDKKAQEVLLRIGERERAREKLDANFQQVKEILFGSDREKADKFMHYLHANEGI